MKEGLVEILVIGEKPMDAAGRRGSSEMARCCANPPPCPTNASSHQYFRSDRHFLGPDALGTGFGYQIHWVPNGASGGHFRADRVL